MASAREQPHATQVDVDRVAARHGASDVRVVQARDPDRPRDQERLIEQHGPKGIDVRPDLVELSVKDDPNEAGDAATAFLEFLQTRGLDIAGRPADKDEGGASLLHDREEIDG
jgi:hypothetical protein